MENTRSRLGARPWNGRPATFARPWPTTPPVEKPVSCSPAEPFTYDAANRRISAEGPAGTTTHSYTPRGEIASATNDYDKSLTYTYDPAGRRTVMDGPNGRTTATYDPVGN